jgi:hypothetical protein
VWVHEKKIRNRDPKREKNLKFWVKGTVPLKFWSKLTAGACNTRSCEASGYRDTCRRLLIFFFTRAWDTRVWVAVTGYARVRYTRLGKKNCFLLRPEYWNGSRWPTVQPGRFSLYMGRKLTILTWFWSIDNKKEYSHDNFENHQAN